MTPDDYRRVLRWVAWMERPDWIKALEDGDLSMLLLLDWSVLEKVRQCSATETLTKHLGSQLLYFVRYSKPGDICRAAIDAGLVKE